MLGCSSRAATPCDSNELGAGAGPAALHTCGQAAAAAVSEMMLTLTQCEAGRKTRAFCQSISARVFFHPPFFCLWKRTGGNEILDKVTVLKDRTGRREQSSKWIPVMISPLSNYWAKMDEEWARARVMRHTFHTVTEVSGNMNCVWLSPQNLHKLSVIALTRIHVLNPLREFNLWQGCSENGGKWFKKPTATVRARQENPKALGFEQRIGLRAPPSHWDLSPGGFLSLGWYLKGMGSFVRTSFTRLFIFPSVSAEPCSSTSPWGAGMNYGAHVLCCGESTGIKEIHSLKDLEVQYWGCTTDSEEPYITNYIKIPHFLGEYVMVCVSSFASNCGKCCTIERLHIKAKWNC